MKADVLERFGAAFRDMAALVEPLDERLLVEPALDGWSVRDVLAHFAGYHHDMAAVFDSLSRGETPPAPDGLTDDERNALYATNARRRLASDVVADWRVQFDGCHKAASRLSEEAFLGERGPRAWLDEEVDHYLSHVSAIRGWLAGLPGPAQEPR